MRRFVVAVMAVLATAWATGGALAQPAPEPLIFAAAKGGPDECGPGCSEWIAAEGYFEGSDLDVRFREFLQTLKGRNLPIVFNSLGGVIGQALILGRVLREHRMTASVGETYPEGCRARITADPSCRQIMQSNRELKARLRTATGNCTSACVFALLGASTRHVPANARVGIHSSAATKESGRPGAPTSEQLFNNRKRYVLEMGADPRIVDEGAKIPSATVRHLSRDEISRYGVETRGPFDTIWMLHDMPQWKWPLIMKAATDLRGADGNEYLTSSVRITCEESRPGTLLQYQREAASNEINVATAIRVAVGNDVRVLRQLKTTRRGVDVYGVPADPQFVQRAVAAGTVVFTETFSPRNARTWSRQIKFSTAGLEQALQTPLKNCSGR